MLQQAPVRSAVADIAGPLGSDWQGGMFSRKTHLVVEPAVNIVMQSYSYNKIRLPLVFSWRISLPILRQ
jgi:hypothetical protein